MSKQPNEQTPRTVEPEATPHRPSKPTPWDPLRHFVKTISPSQREQLLRLEIPLLPPEDFMDTGQFRALRRARLRRWAPAILGCAAGLLIIVIGFMTYSRSQARARDAGGAKEALVHASPALSLPAIAAPPAPPSATISAPVVAPALAPVTPATPSSTAAVPGVSVQQRGVPATSPKPAPNSSSAPSKPKGSDLETPW